jgi:hypothetical protein
MTHHGGHELRGREMGEDVIGPKNTKEARTYGEERREGQPLRSGSCERKVPGGGQRMGQREYRRRSSGRRLWGG